MSLARTATFAFSGITAVPVEVQVQLSPGLPNFQIVGLADKAVGESRERVRAALTGLGLSLPAKRVLVNLAPADLAKEGSHYDLPIALALMAAMEVVPKDELATCAALGELALDGTILPVSGVLPAALAAAERGWGLVCPAAQGGEAAWAGGAEIAAARDLTELLAHFRRDARLLRPEAPPLPSAPWRGPCLSEVKGQEAAKRALEIAAAGGHNLLILWTEDLTLKLLSRLHLRAAVRCEGCGAVGEVTPAASRAEARGDGYFRGEWRCANCGGASGHAELSGMGWIAGPAPVPMLAPVGLHVRTLKRGDRLVWFRPDGSTEDLAAGTASLKSLATNGPVRIADVVVSIL